MKGQDNQDHLYKSMGNGYIDLFEGLKLGRGKVSNDGGKKVESVDQKQKTHHLITKKDKIKRCYKKRTKTVKQANKNKITRLQERIKQLQQELQNTKKKFDKCPNCLLNVKQTQQELKNNFITDYDEQMKKISNHLQSSSASRQSLQFQKIDFNTPSLFNTDLDDRAWIYLGTLMIIMGSKCLDVDGTMNVFKVLKQSVDSLRRQVDKSLSSISMDFFLVKQQMHQDVMDKQIGFDPFTHKQQNNGLLLEGVKIQSVQQFELVYDNKITFNLKYQALISSMEFLRNNCWFSF